MSLFKKSKEPRFQKNESYSPKNSSEDLLIKAMSLLKSEKDAAAFLRDLLTPAEIEEFANRIEIARLLLEGGKSYQQIANEIGTSTTTVTRVAHWLFQGCGGYWNVLNRLLKGPLLAKK